MDRAMQTMREMHEKMVAAKTSDERKALMGDHMKAMQDGMVMMKKMDAADGMPSMGAMMHKRMEMMTGMMQMMMDRLPTAPAP